MKFISAFVFVSLFAIAPRASACSLFMTNDPSQAQLDCLVEHDRAIFCDGPQALSPKYKALIANELAALNGMGKPSYEMLCGADLRDIVSRLRKQLPASGVWGMWQGAQICTHVEQDRSIPVFDSYTGQQDKPYTFQEMLDLNVKYATLVLCRGMTARK